MKLSNYQYDRLIQLFDERRMKARYDAEKRLKEIYEKFPYAKELDERMASESIDAGRAALEGNTEKLENLSSRIDELKSERDRLLISGGYEADYTEEHFRCESCKDTGFIGNEPCGCFKTAMTEMVFEESNLKDVIDKENFNTFRLDLYSDDPEDYDKELKCTPYKNMTQVLFKAKLFAENFSEEKRNLLIYGNTGLGKTFLTNCIASKALTNGHTVLYYTTFGLFDLLSKYSFKYEDFPKEEFVYREGLLTCELLIIDDLGTELTSSFTTTQLYSIINERLLNGLSTVISTNLTPAQIDGRYGERIFSRLSKDYDFIKLIGRDLRTMI